MGHNARLQKSKMEHSFVCLPPGAARTHRPPGGGCGRQVTGLPPGGLGVVAWAATAQARRACGASRGCLGGPCSGRATGPFVGCRFPNPWRLRQRSNPEGPRRRHGGLAARPRAGRAWLLARPETGQGSRPSNAPRSCSFAREGAALDLCLPPPLRGAFARRGRTAELNIA